MKKNIVLINPWIYDFAAYDFWMKPLGLLYIASVLRQNGHNVRLIDCVNSFNPLLKMEHKVKQFPRRSSGHGKLPKETIPKPHPLSKINRNYNRYGITANIFMKDLKSLTRPDLVLVTSMMTYWYPGVFDVISVIKHVYPGIPIILGGVYVTLCPEHASLSGADFTVSGEGENSILAVVKELFGIEPLFAPDTGNLDCLPYPAFDLLPIKDQVPILTSRGCPYACSYCASHRLNKNFRRRDPIHVVDEISFWQRNFGVKHFSFYDDALLVNAEEVAIPMLEELMKRKLPCHYHCPNGLHLRDVSEKLSRLMFSAGFKTIRFGFESSNELTQVTTGGKVNNEQFKIAVGHLRKAGYTSEDIGVYLLCGLPGQEAREVRDSIHYVQSCGARPIIAEYSPIPGTALWDSAVSHSPFDIEREPLFHNNSLLPCQSEKLTFDVYQELKLMTRIHS
jgi:radical SAM superfamily enzyme YgiQ (UPF0313 family)